MTLLGTFTSTLTSMQEDVATGRRLYWSYYLGHVTAEGSHFLLLFVVIVELPDGPRHDDGEGNTCEENREKSPSSPRQRPLVLFIFGGCRQRSLILLEPLAVLLQTRTRHFL